MTNYPSRLSYSLVRKNFLIRMLYTDVYLSVYWCLLTDILYMCYLLT